MSEPEHRHHAMVAHLTEDEIERMFGVAAEAGETRHFFDGEDQGPGRRVRVVGRFTIWHIDGGLWAIDDETGVLLVGEIALRSAMNLAITNAQGVIPWTATGLATLVDKTFAERPYVQHVGAQTLATALDKRTGKGVKLVCHDQTRTLAIIDSNESVHEWSWSKQARPRTDDRLSKRRSELTWPPADGRAHVAHDLRAHFGSAAWHDGPAREAITLSVEDAIALIDKCASVAVLDSRIANALLCARASMQRESLWLANGSESTRRGAPKRLQADIAKLDARVEAATGMNFGDLQRLAVPTISSVRFAEKRSQAPTPFTPPSYDDVFAEGTRLLDDEDDEPCNDCEPSE